MTDTPQTGKNDPDFNHSVNKPKKGELFTRKADGTVQLKQTTDMFGKVKK